MVFIPTEEVQHSSVVPPVMVEKAAGDFFREEWVEEPGITMQLEGLEEGVVLMDLVGALVVEVVTLGVVVGIMNLTPVEEEEDPTTMEQISKMNAVTILLDMVRFP